MELAARFGTPLYVLDESVIRARCAEVRRDFLDRWPNASASYASKAFLTRTMARIVEEEGLGLDVVSLGELHTALSAGFPASRIEMHGSAKSEAELNAALDAGVGCIVVDGLMELEVLADLAARRERRAEILLRVTPTSRRGTRAASSGCPWMETFCHRPCAWLWIESLSRCEACTSTSGPRSSTPRRTSGPSYGSSRP